MPIYQYRETWNNRNIPMSGKKVKRWSLAIGAMVAAICLAQGALAAACSGIYHGLGTAGQANGTQTLPGTDVGTVQAGCQIGDLATNNVSGTGVFVSPTATPSIFQF